MYLKDMQYKCLHCESVTWYRNNVWLCFSNLLHSKYSTFGPNKKCSPICTSLEIPALINGKIPVSRRR